MFLPFSRTVDWPSCFLAPFSKSPHCIHFYLTSFVFCTNEKAGIQRPNNCCSTSSLPLRSGCFFTQWNCHWLSHILDHNRHNMSKADTFNASIPSEQCSKWLLLRMELWRRPRNRWGFQFSANRHESSANTCFLNNIETLLAFKGNINIWPQLDVCLLTRDATNVVANGV